VSDQSIADKIEALVEECKSTHPATAASLCVIAASVWEGDKSQRQINDVLMQIARDRLACIGGRN
jgi:hypothetical protein